MDKTKNPLTEMENWEILCGFLPPDWAEQACHLGAMRRARYISDPGTVLRILLLHLAAGCSLAETAARAAASGLAQISAVGVYKRLRAAEPWLRWLAQQMRGAADVPMGMAGRRLRAVDATWVSEPGSTGSSWKVHWAVNLADLQCDFFELSDLEPGGETFRRVPVAAGDILVGDRVYAAPPGVSHVVRAQGDVVVRLNRQALPLFARPGRRMNLWPFLRRLKGKTPQEREALVRNSDDGWIEGRLIALRQSAEATRRIRRRLRRRAQRSRETVSEESLQFAEYFMVWTTLPQAFPAASVLEFYRLRWQIELVFKRMKSILGLGHLPKSDPLSAKAWLEGKLFTGLLIERMVRAAESLSPWGYALAAPAQPLARD
jgi:Transposase DDE domain